MFRDFEKKQNSEIAILAARAAKAARKKRKADPAPKADEPIDVRKGS